MKLGLGLGIGGSGNSLPRYVTDFANGFELPGDTFTGGPTVVADNDGTLVTSPADVLPIEGMRLTDGVWLPTDLSGDPIHASTPLRTTKGTVQKYAETYKGPLIEPARTNLLTYSERFDNGDWLKTSVIVTPNTSIAPDGTTTASTVQFSSTTARIFQVATSKSFPIGAFSVWLRANTPCKINIYTSNNLAWGSGIWGEVYITTAWQRFIISGSGSAGNDAFDTTGFGCIDPATGTSDLPPVTIEAWGSQLEDGSFPTSYIPTGATTVTRPAANLTRPTAGTALASLNNWAVLTRFRPTAAGQTAVLWGSYTDANNATQIDLAPTTLTFKKRLEGVDYTAQASLTHAADTLYEALLYQHSVHGMGIMVRSWNGSAWSAWSAWATNADTQNAPIASTYQIGARNNANHFAANYPFTEIIRLNPNLHPQTQLASLLAKGRI